jgi:hypothetical protein
MGQIITGGNQTLNSEYNLNTSICHKPPSRNVDTDCSEKEGFRTRRKGRCYQQMKKKLSAENVPLRRR